VIRFREAVATVVLASVVALVSPAWASAVGKSAAPGEAVPGEILVRFEPGATSGQRAALRRLAGANDTQPVGVPRLELLELPPGETTEAIRRLRSSRLVAYAEPNRVYRVTGLPDDALFGELWGLHNTGQRTGYLSGTPDADIDAPEAWEYAGPTAQVTVAVVDTGVDAGHPDIGPQLTRSPGSGAYGYDFVSEDDVPEDQNGHGTHVAATIAARAGDGFGVAGVAPGARIMALRAFDAEGSGEAADIVRAIQFAALGGAKVVNASFSGGPSNAISDAIAGAPNVLFVAAAGNANDDLDDGTARYPCAYTHINLVCVGATDRNDHRAWYSNHGQVSVDLFAPGSEVLSAFVTQQERFIEDFEGDGWQSWSLSGHWRRTADAAATGGFGLGHMPGGPYTIDNAAVSEAVDLSGADSCRLSFALDLDIQGTNSWLRVAYDTPSGGKTLASFGRDWRETIGLDLPTSLPVQIAFEMFTDRVGDDPGVASNDRAFIDDVTIHCRPGPGGAAAFERLSGTSMAAPHVAGVAALMWGAEPAASLVRVRCALLEGVDRIDGLARLSSTGGRLNAAGALAAPPPDPPQPRSGTIDTVAGSDAPPSFGGDGGSATGARLNTPAGVAVRDGELLIADSWNHRIRRVGPDGVISTVAGSGDGFSGDGGPATEARLAVPGDVEFTPHGGFLIADTYNDRIRRVAPDGSIHTAAGSSAWGSGGDGGPATAAQLNQPEGIAALPDGGFLIADTRNARVRRVAPDGTIATVAGTGHFGHSGDGGPARQAALAWPRDVESTPDGGFLVADTRNNRVRKVNPDGTITTVAGTGVPAHAGDHGPARLAAVHEPAGLAVRPDGSFLVSGRDARVREVAVDGTIRTVAGSDGYGFSGDGGPAILAKLHDPLGIAATDDGVLIADAVNHRIRRVFGPPRDVDTLPRACRRTAADPPLTAPPSPPPPPPPSPGDGPGGTDLGRPERPGAANPDGTTAPGARAPASNQPLASLRALARQIHRALARSRAHDFSKRGIAARFSAPARGSLHVRLVAPGRGGRARQVVGKGGARTTSPGQVAFRIRATRLGRTLLRRRPRTPLVIEIAWRAQPGGQSVIRGRARLAGA
jgi:subtilisin family serine protease